MCVYVCVCVYSHSPCSNEKDSATASNTIVVYDTDQWYLIDYVVANNALLSNTSLQKLADVFPGVYSAASKFIVSASVVCVCWCVCESVCVVCV